MDGLGSFLRRVRAVSLCRHLPCAWHYEEGGVSLTWPQNPRTHSGSEEEGGGQGEGCADQE